MHTSYLIQRLNKPFVPKDEKQKVLAAFGEALSNTGIPENIMKHLRNIADFDYMGSSEFEWGAVPKALKEVASRANSLTTATITFEPDEIYMSDFDSRDYCRPKKAVSIYILASKDHMEGAKALITRLVKEDKFSIRLKECAYVSESCLDRSKEYLKRAKGFDGSRHVGWFEMDNGFFFFLDRKMFDQFCTILHPPKNKVH